MEIKECIISKSGITCIAKKNWISVFNIFKYVKNDYFKGYVVLRLLEMIIKDINENKQEFHFLNNKSLFLDFS